MPGNKSKIRLQFMKMLFPEKLIISEEEKKQEQNGELEKLAKLQKGTKECEMCEKRKKREDFITLTPCGHQFCLECLETRFSQSIESREIDRDSLVCPDCQSYIHYPNITYILRAKPLLLDQLSDETTYNIYTRQQECPHCGKLMFWDKNHTEQRCQECHYQFCSECLLPTHEAPQTCKQAIERHKKNKQIVQKAKPAYAMCPECFTYGRKVKGLEIARCAYCKRLFCPLCKKFFDKKHQCAATPALVESILRS